MIDAPESVTVDGVLYVRAYPVADGKCPACGFARGVWTAPLVVRALRAWNETHGRPPKADEWRGRAEPHRPTLTTVLDLFGTWNRAVAAAGLATRRARGHRRWSREQILEALAEWARAHDGAPPTCEDWESPSNANPTPQTVARCFGSWNAALDAAGFFPRGPYGVRLRASVGPEPVRFVDAAPVAVALRAESADRSLTDIAGEVGCDPSYLQKIVSGSKTRIREDFADRILTTIDRPYLLPSAA